MADSGQQPTGRAEFDTLVDEIFEMLTEMEIKRIDYSSHKLYFDTILRDLPSFSPEVSAGRLRKFMSMLQKKFQTHNLQTRLTSLTGRTSQQPLATHTVKIVPMPGIIMMPCKTARMLPVLVLCERRQRQNERLSALME